MKEKEMKQDVLDDDAVPVTVQQEGQFTSLNYTYMIDLLQFAVDRYIIMFLNPRSTHSLSLRFALRKIQSRRKHQTRKQERRLPRTRTLLFLPNGPRRLKRFDNLSTVFSWT
jgi:hypothetical protein